MSKLNKLVKMGGRVFAGALLCGSMMFGTVSAAEAPAIIFSAAGEVWESMKFFTLSAMIFLLSAESTRS